jgi:hypothetical protein
MTHLLTVYLHLIASCAAIGVILATDLKLFQHLFRAHREPLDQLHIAIEIRIIVTALLVLWLSGILLLWQGFLVDPEYLLNQKLQAKVLLVCLLTLNAFALHSISLPRISALPDHSDYVLTILFPSVSNSIWFYCAFLGVARLWNHSVSLVFVLQVWLIIWLFVVAAMYIAIRTLKSRMVRNSNSAVVV